MVGFSYTDMCSSEGTYLGLESFSNGFKNLLTLQKETKGKRGGDRERKGADRGRGQKERGEVIIRQTEEGEEIDRERGGWGCDREREGGRG